MPRAPTNRQVRAERVFANLLPNLGIGWVIPLWRSAVQPVVPAWMANYAFVLVFLTLFPWLMGPLKVRILALDVTHACSRSPTLPHAVSWRLGRSRGQPTKV